MLSTELLLLLLLYLAAQWGSVVACYGADDLGLRSRGIVAQCATFLMSPGIFP